MVALPQGGVPVAYEVARRLGAPLDVIVVRKLGVPYQPELAFGALGEDGVRVINDRVVAETKLAREEMAKVERRERRELSRRTERLRRAHPCVPLSGRTAIVIDDGIATGATARAACRVARARDARRVVLAVPVAPRDTVMSLRDVADEMVCLEAPPWFGAVGCWYRRFGQVTDAEVKLLLRAAGNRRDLSRRSVRDPPSCDGDLQVSVREGRLVGHLTIPEHPLGMVVFAHGSGSSRHSPRNRFVAEVLNRAGLGTLLVDLLTPYEEFARPQVFDIGLLARRLLAVTVRLIDRDDVAGLRIGYFGAGTGAAAALRAAAGPGMRIAAVVSRGGRPDLAGSALAAVRAPTLLIVGGHDHVGLQLNRHATREMPGETVLVVVPGATHLFAEPGALEKVAELACDWLVTRLAPASAVDSGTSRWR
nr:phosphoribosyltransferase family protein [Nocardia brevicatena]